MKGHHQKYYIKSLSSGLRDEGDQVVWSGPGLGQGAARDLEEALDREEVLESRSVGQVRPSGRRGAQKTGGRAEKGARLGSSLLQGTGLQSLRPARRRSPQE